MLAASFNVRRSKWQSVDVDNRDRTAVWIERGQTAEPMRRADGSTVAHR
jgi:hypothetical protein